MTDELSIKQHPNVLSPYIISAFYPPSNCACDEFVKSVVEELHAIGINLPICDFQIT